ncbi:proline-rich transmembrane protein 4 [Pungitius pungitius]|uniref:proline-rich transmembrane protein 4 n=1 Tax=Pungitius pungitius TaxID=134920 RepID=UPI002E1545F2
MLRLLQTVALCFWCSLLLHRQAAADEEAFWPPMPSREKPPEISYWWTPPLPKLPSLPSLPFRIPFYGGSKGNDGSAPTAKGPTEPTDGSQGHLGSGDGSFSEASESPTTLSQALPTGATKIGTVSLPNGTSDPPHSSSSSSIAHSDKEALVLDSHAPTSSSVRRTLVTDGPTGTGAPERNATHTRPQRGQLPGEHRDEEAKGFTENLLFTTAAETTVPSAFTRTAAETTTTTTSTTITPGPVETTLPSSDPLGLVTPSASAETTFVEPRDSTFDITLRAAEATRTEPPPTSRSGPAAEEKLRVYTAATGIDYKPLPESITSPTRSQRVDFPMAGEPPGREDEGDEGDGGGAAPSADISRTPAEPPTTPPPPPPQSTETPHIPPYTDDWMYSQVDSDATLLPDCNKERSGICNLSDTWDLRPPSDAKPTQNATATNRSAAPHLIPAPPMLVPLYTDWNSAMAAWGVAWEAHVYGAGCAFAALALASALNLLCLPLRCPSGCGYFALVSLFLLAAGGTRSFSLLYDAYGHRDRLPSAEASLVLYEAPFPCLTAAFGLVFLLLSMRSRMQLSYSAFQRPCFLACLVAVHFGAAFGPVTLLEFYRQKPPLCLFLSLVSRGAFVALATFLSAAYFVFYIYVRADSKHIYHLNNTSPTPAERYNRCPFAESRDWDRAALTVCVSALFCLACAGLQFYAMLNAMGVAGGEEVFHPWPWWAFQFSCRLCELGVCLTLALVVAQPVYCSDHLPAAGSCWTELLASKSPILPGSYQWTLSQQEKLAIVDTVGLGEMESLPLYTLVDERLGSSLNGLDLLYHSNRALAYRDLDLDLDLKGSRKPEDVGRGEPSGGSSFTSDSTADLRPPSPINLRRSIDEALFSEALFPTSLFSPARPTHCSDLSISDHRAPQCNGLCDPLSADAGLYRTSSCVEVAAQGPLEPSRARSQGDTSQGGPPSPSLSSSSSCSSPERWRGSSSSSCLYREPFGGSSLVLCPSPERRARQLLQQGAEGHAASSGQRGHADPRRNYHTLGAASQESLDLDLDLDVSSSEADRSAQEEFIGACRQIDALSICSETIDL